MDTPDSATTLNVSVPESMQSFVERLVQGGQSTSPSEVFRDLIRERMRAEETERRHRALAKSALAALPRPIETRRLLGAIGLFEAGVSMGKVSRAGPFTIGTAVEESSIGATQMSFRVSGEPLTNTTHFPSARRIQASESPGRLVVHAT